MSHCCSLVLLHVGLGVLLSPIEWVFFIVGVSLLLTQWLCIVQSVPLKFSGLACVISGFPPLLSGSLSIILSCLTVLYYDSLCSLGLPIFIHLPASYHPRHTIAAHLGDAVSFQFSQCHSLRWLFLISGVSLFLTAVILCSFMCSSVVALGLRRWPITTHWHSSILSQEVNCPFLQSLCYLKCPTTPF